MRTGPQYGVTRRRLLRAGPAGAVSATAAEKSRVVIACDAALRGARGTADAARALKRPDRAMEAFYTGSSAAEAGKKLVHPGRGSARGTPTSIGRVDPVCERLQKARAGNPGIRNGGSRT